MMLATLGLVLLAVTVNSADIETTKPTPAQCHSNGVAYDYGVVHVTDDCKMCQCDQSGLVCSDVRCVKILPDCIEENKTGCCSVCVKYEGQDSLESTTPIIATCNSKGIVYTYGLIYNLGTCKTCECAILWLLCYDERDVCPDIPPDCIEVNNIGCCPVCNKPNTLRITTPTPMQCHSDGVAYDYGVVYVKDVCKMCQCDQSGLVCSDAQCATLPADCIEVNKTACGCSVCNKRKASLVTTTPPPSTCTSKNVIYNYGETYKFACKHAKTCKCGVFRLRCNDNKSDPCPSLPPNCIEEKKEGCCTVCANDKTTPTQRTTTTDIATPTVEKPTDIPTTTSTVEKPTDIPTTTSTVEKPTDISTAMTTEGGHIPTQTPTPKPTPKQCHSKGVVYDYGVIYQIVPSCKMCECTQDEFVCSDVKCVTLPADCIEEKKDGCCTVCLKRKGDITLPTTKPTPAKCYFNNVAYNYGSVYRLDGCKRCQCGQYGFHCSDPNCATLPPDCIEEKQDNCCAVCVKRKGEIPVPNPTPKQCHSKGVVYNYGVIHKIVPSCQMCECSQDELLCSDIQCATLPHDCIEEDKVGGCCPVCIKRKDNADVEKTNKVQCHYKGVPYDAGVIYKMSACNTCECTQYGFVCSDAECAAMPLDCIERRKDTCCTVCIKREDNGLLPPSNLDME